MRCGCDDQEFWTLKDGDNLLEQYDYKGFRYVRLDFPKNVTIQSVSMLVRHFPFPEKPACVQSENPVLEQIFTLCTNGVRYGSQESFIDCPTREKGQYTGDLTITGASHLLLTADPSLLRRAIALQVDSLRIAPGMLAVTPGSWMQEIADYSLQFPLSVMAVLSVYRRSGVFCGRCCRHVRRSSAILQSTHVRTGCWTE